MSSTSATIESLSPKEVRVSPARTRAGVPCSARSLDRSVSMRWMLTRGVALLAALALVVPLTVEAQGKGTIKIATQSPLSGELAALGEGIKLGTQLALEKFKGPVEKAGFKVDLVPFDDQAKPDVGVANAKNIIADKDILAVIGHLNSGVALPSSEVYKEVNVVMVSPGL